MGGVTQPQRSFYDEVGGHDTFNTIVSRFYALVREDEILLPLYRGLFGVASRRVGLLRVHLCLVLCGTHTRHVKGKFNGQV